MRIIIPLFILLLAAPAWGAPAGILQQISGEVSLRSGSSGIFVSARQGETVQEGDSIKTGAAGWAKLMLSDGSSMTLANRTELEVSTLKIGRSKREGVFNLAEGKLRASVTKLAGQQTDYRVKSRTAVAGVKGTDFMILSRGEANVLFGNDGEVQVAGAKKEEAKQPLSGGTMVQTTRGALPTVPVSVDKGSALAEAREVFTAATGASPPAEWVAADLLPDLLARWNVNYGHYLADRGDYEQSLMVFQIAIDLTAVSEIRADAWLERGAVHGRFLNNPRAALAEYLLVLEEYPLMKQAEIALFCAGQTLYELNLPDQAAARFRQYLKTYPQGRYRSSVETLLRQVEGVMK